MKIKFWNDRAKHIDYGDVKNLYPDGSVLIKTLNSWYTASVKEIIAICPDEGHYSEPSLHLQKLAGWKKIPKCRKIPEKRWRCTAGEFNQWKDWVKRSKELGNNR